MSVTSRDRWVRSRFKVWLTHCIDTHAGVTINSLSRWLAGDTLGDYRGTLRAYCRGTTTVSPERAFAIGEAIADIAPGGPVNGLVSLAVAGYYEEYLAFLEALYSIPFDWHDMGSQLLAVNVPLFAEFEIARLSGNLGAIAQAAHVAIAGNDREWVRFTHRAVMNAYRFLTRVNAAQYVLLRSKEDPYPSHAAWRDRWDPPDASSLDESSDDRRTLVRMAKFIVPFAGGLEPDRLAAVLLDFVWQWVHLANPPERKRDYQVMELLRRLFDVNAQRRHRKRNFSNYELVSLGSSVTALIPKSNKRVLALAPEERIDDLKQYAEQFRRIVISTLRDLHRLTTTEPVATWVRTRRSAYDSTFVPETDPSASQLLSSGLAMGASNSQHLVNGS